MSTPLGFQTKAELIYERICSAILSGQLRPGERVNSDALARELRVSKIPVREALQKLEAQGLVVQSPHSGARVATLSFHEMKGIYLVRGELEGLAARVAAETITPAELRTLDGIQEEMVERLAKGDTSQQSVLNQRFHRTIAAATRFTTLAELIELALLRVARYRVGIHRFEAAWHQVLDEHAAIIAALHAHDPVAAEAASRTHVARQLQVELEAQSDPTLFSDTHPASS